MIKCVTENFQTFREAILETASNYPALVPPTAAPLEDFADVVGAFLADGNCGWVVLLAGREFASKLLESVANAEDYDVCIALREAIKSAISIYDNQGEPGSEFVTAAYESLVAKNPTPNVTQLL